MNSKNSELFCLIWIILITQLSAAIEEDGLCQLYTFLPFTNNGTSAVPLTDQPPERQTNPGFSHLASALMAMEDFNAKKSQVVPELEELSNCTVKFDLNTSLFFDTGSVTHQASRSLVDSGEIPCAIAGPFNDFPALELSTLAQAVRIPLVAHRAVNLRVTWENYSPFSHCTFPSPLTLMAEAVSYLQFIGRTDYISLFYTLSDTGTQINEVFTLNMDERGITSFSQSFEDTFRSSRQILPTMRKLKERGYRTILTYMEYATVEFPIIADAAEELGMNNGDYLWMWHGFIDPAHLYSDNPNITKLLQGSVWPGPAEQHFLFPEDPFLASWHSKDDEFVDLVNSMNPIQPGEPGYFVATDGYFQRAYPEYGTGYIYDAVMSLGIGACAAQAENDTVSAEAHVRGIRASRFSGATGPVYFGTESDFLPGSRAFGTTQWSVFNILPPGGDFVFSMSYWKPAGSQEWILVNEDYPFVYADGRTVPPGLLRDIPEQNYLSPGYRIFGLILMTEAILLAILSAAWIYRYRKHKVLRAAQPELLYLICFGSALSASTIFPLSFDEGAGWSVNQLSRACRSVPWLIILGQVLVYCSLFTKLWRVHRVLQFRRRTIKVHHVAWPMAACLCMAILILTCWTVIDPLLWDRKVLDEDSGESIGQCESDSLYAYTIPVLVAVLIPAGMTSFMAYKTKDVDDAYSESSWFYTLMLVQLETVIVAVPTVFTLLEVSANGRYIGLAILLWIFPTSTIGLIIGPKMWAHYRSTHDLDRSNQSKRGQAIKGHVRISGLNPTPDPTPVNSKMSQGASQLFSSQASGSDSPPELTAGEVSPASLVKQHGKLSSE